MGGSGSQGTVTLTGPAPSEGVVVTLTNSNTSVATVPGTVTVPGGATSANFPVNTLTVTSPTDVTISAIYGGATQTAILTVMPAALSSLSLVPSNVTGGNNSQGTVILDGPAPSGGAVVALKSGNSSVATVPANVIVPSGNTTATFTIDTQSVKNTNQITISATYNGITATDRLRVTRN